MSAYDRVSFIGLPTGQLASVVGQPREIILDMTKKTATVHDGMQAGGYPLLREDGDGSRVMVKAPGSTTARSQAQRAGDVLNVRDYGATPLLTAADNTLAFQRAIDAAPMGATLLVTGGNFALNEGALVFGSKRMRVVLDGATINGSFPIAIKAIVDGQFEGGRRVVQSAGAGPTDFAQHFSFRRADYVGGTDGAVNAGIRHVTEVRDGALSYEWGGVYILDNYASAGQHIALVGQGHKRLGAGATWTAHLEHIDYQNNPTTASVLAEFGFRANGGDSYGNRVLLDVNYAQRVGGDGTTPEIASGVRIGPAYGDAAHGKLGTGILVHGDTGTVLRGDGTSTNTTDSALIRDTGTREYGLDLGGATYRSGYAMRIKAGAKFAFEETGAVAARWNAGAARVEFLNGATPVFTAGAAGITSSGPALAPIWRTAQVTIADDAVYTHQMPTGNNSAVVLVYATSTNYGTWLVQAFLRVVGGNEGIVPMFAGSASSVILGDVTGTSGTDGHLILAAPPAPAGGFKILNRTGASRIFNIVVL